MTDPLEAPWQALLSDWESDARHRGFVALAVSLERLPDAARRYRAELSDATRAARAQQGLDRILAVAMQALTPPPREERPRSINVMLPLGAFAALLIVTVFAAQVTGFRALTSPLVIFGEAVIVALVPWRRLSSGG